MAHRRSKRNPSPLVLTLRFDPAEAERLRQALAYENATTVAGWAKPLILNTVRDVLAEAAKSAAAPKAVGSAVDPEWERRKKQARDELDAAARHHGDDAGSED
jgi:hypothetical protein